MAKIKEDKSTVFIIGAGAGKPYNFPLGDELKSSIVSSFPRLYMKRVYGGNPGQISAEIKSEEIAQFTEALNRAVGTIDSHISRNPKWQKWGKLAISMMISEAEKKYFDLEKKNIQNGIPIETDWIEWLVNRMISDLDNMKDFRISQHSISFITFNYDRLLEHLLINLLWNTFKQQVDTIGQIVDELKKIEIVHIYGALDNLHYPPQLKGSQLGNAVPGPRFDIVQNNIRVMNQERNRDEKDDTIDKAAKLLHNARRVFFLGFGYDSENLSQIKIPRVLKEDVEIYGTAIGMEDAEIDRVKHLMTGKTDERKENIVLEKISSLTLLKRYL